MYETELATAENNAAHAAELIKHFGDYEWRIDNLYKIKDKDGNAVPFKLNFAQWDLLENLHYLNAILKARQLGFSTFIDIHGLDWCLFYPNQSFGIIAQGEDEAQKLLSNVKFSYQQLPAYLKETVQLTKENAGEMEFSNGSKIVAGISLRSGTYQILHVSEYGKTSAKFPEKAREIKTGAFNTVHTGNQIFVESTAEGQGGEFYNLVKTARKLEDAGKDLTPLDFKFHFYAWWKHPDYRLPTEEALKVVITNEYATYFEELYKQDFIDLDLEQKAWYVKKADIMGEDMWREFPSTPDEAFKASVEGAIYPRQMRFLRKHKRITSVPYDPRYPVHTFWDFGNANYMAIWFFQQVGRERRMIRFYQDTSKDFSQYVKFMNDMDYNYGNCYVPHDGATTRMMETGNRTYKQMLENLGVKNVKVIPVTQSKWMDIETICKPALMELWIDEVNCADGIKCLDNYKKKRDRNGIFLKEPDHDEFSDGADAFRTYAVGYKEIVVSAPPSFRMPSGARPI